MAFIPQAQVAYVDGEVAAWVDFTTSPQGRLQQATLTVAPGMTCSWFLVDDTQTRYDGALTNPLAAVVNIIQSWNLNNLGLTSYSFGMTAARSTS